MNASRVRLIAIVCTIAASACFQGCEVFHYFDKDDARVLPPATTLPPQEEDILLPPAEPLPPPVVEETKAPITIVQPVAPEVRYYTVAKGDTLSEIARREGVRTPDVIAMNAGINPNRLSIGQTITLPAKGSAPASPATLTPSREQKQTGVKPLPPPEAVTAKDGKSVTYTVASGDSLSVIASRFGVKVADIKAANKLKSDVIRVGQKLAIPAPTKTYTAPTGTTASDVKTTKKNATTPTTPATPTTPTGVTPGKEPPAPGGDVPGALDIPALLPDAAAEPAVPVLPASTGETAQKYTTYTVKEGEDIVSIALRWGISFMDLKAINNLTDSKLPVGTTIKIPITE